MSQTTDLIKTLKKCLKSNNMGYFQLAGRMGLSESTIKRLFSQESFSLKRIEEICHIIDIDMFDLASMAKREREKGDKKITVEQETALIDDPRLLAFFYFLMNGWPLSTIKDDYFFSENEITKNLLELDRVGLIELHPNNRYRLLIKKNAFYRKRGPIWKYFHEIIKTEFLNLPFDSSDSRLDFLPGLLSPSSVKIFLKKIDELIIHYNELVEMDHNLHIKDRRSYALHIGFSTFVLSYVDEMKKGK